MEKMAEKICLDTDASIAILKDEPRGEALIASIANIKGLSTLKVN